MKNFDDILSFWFGHVEQTLIPSEELTRIWFAEDSEADKIIRERFSEDLTRAIAGEYDAWQGDPRGQLALILILDQFSRHIYRNTPQAYAQDNKALEICIKGIQDMQDHSLSLIERAFYYFPLLHSEDLGIQEQSLRAYGVLSELSFPETRVIYDSFLKFAVHHYRIVQQFGRFPQRNAVLGRDSTEAELTYLKETKS